MRISRLPRLIQWMLSIGVVLLLLMTLFRLFFYFFFNNQGTSLGSLGGAFFLGLRFDLRTIAAICLPLLIVGSFRPLNPFSNKTARNTWMLLLTIVAFLFGMFYVVDFGHYAYLAQRLNASVLNYLQDAAISKKMVGESYPVFSLVAAIILITAIASWLFYRRYKLIAGRPVVVTRRGRKISFIVSFLIIAFLLFGRFNQYPLRWSDAFDLGSDYEANVSLNPFETFFNTLKFRATTTDENKLRAMYPVMARYYGFQPDTALNFSRTIAATDTGLASRPNIVLVICESFSGYKSSMWKNPLNTTPFFDSLCRQGIFFDHCFTPSYGTARGVWATLTGLPDVQIGTTSSRNPAAVDQHTIMNDFVGYEKYYFIGGSPSWANIRGLLMNNIAGLHLYSEDNFDAPKLDVWGISDKNLLLGSNKVLATETKPFFAIIQTADNHRPYTIPKEDTDFNILRTTEDSLNRFGFSDQVSYDLKLKEYNAFRYTDYGFKKFMEAASRERYFSNTIFVFIGDHGIAGDVGDMFPQSWTAQRLTAVHVPLLFYWPGRLTPKRSSSICSQLDVMPSIASLAGISYNNTALGRNLFDSSTKAFAYIFDPDYRQTGIIMGDYYYRKNFETGKEEMVSIRNNMPADTIVSTQADMKQLSDAVYLAAQYLILNNKKKPQAGK